MKRNRLLLPVSLLFVGATAFVVADDVISRLGMEDKTSRYYILGNVVGTFSDGPIENYDGDYEDNRFKIPYMKLLPQIISGDKVGAAKELCEYTRNYINSQEFMADYNARREDGLPLEDQGARISTLRGNMVVYQKNINNYKTDTKYVAEQQAKMDEDQKRLNGLLEKAKGDFPGRDVWEANFPADPSVLVKKKLEEYLKLVATVDFNAQLIDKNRQKVFANAAFEKKSNKWKACYRAGKEVNDVVKAFVQNWLKGEIVAKTKISMPLAEKASSTSKSSAASSTTSSSAPASTGNSTSSAPAASTSTPAPAPASGAEKQVKEKKASLFNKLKDKAKGVTDAIKN